MWRFIYRAVNRAFGYGDASSTKDNVPSSSSAAQPQPGKVRPRGKGKGKGKTSQQAPKVNQPNVSEDVEMSDDIDAATGSSSRPVRQPKHQQDIRRNPNKAPDVPAANLVIEESTAEDPLHENYTGTVNGIQYYTPDYTQDHKCGHINEHKLACNHWVKSSEPCGCTCRGANTDVEAFICPRCYTTASDTLLTKLTREERFSLVPLRQCPIDLLITFFMIALSRYTTIAGGVVELAKNMAMDGTYGRACEASDGPVSYMPISDFAAAVAKTTALNKKATDDPLTKHDKRESDEPGRTSKRMKLVTNNTIKIAGSKRDIVSLTTMPAGASNPIPLPASRNSAKRQHVERYYVNHIDGVKRTTPGDFDRCEAKRVKTMHITHKVPEVKWYGKLAVFKMANGSTRAIKRDTNRYHY